MIILFVAAGVVVAAVAALALKSWALLVAVLGVHFVASAIVVGVAWRGAGDTSGKPDPVTEARLEEERSAGGDRFSGARTGTS